MATLFGSGIKRREDPRLITGKATYTDDVKLPGLLYAAVLRSTYAHAKLRKVDVAKAKQATGVVAVYTGADVKDKVNTVPCAWNVPNCDPRRTPLSPSTKSATWATGSPWSWPSRAPRRGMRST